MSKRIAVGQQPDTGQRFDGLFDSHYVAIHRYCARRLGISDAEDAAAEVFAVAWRRLGEMPEGESSRAWLFGVAYRVIGNRYRSRLRQSKLTRRLAESRPVAEPWPGPELSSGGTDVELLLTALRELSPSDSELLRLSAWDDLSRSEIALVLGIKENAVDQRLHRAKARLKERLVRLNSRASHIETTEASA